MHKYLPVLLGAVAALGAAAWGVQAQDAMHYGDKLGTIPVQNSTRASVGGTGYVNATLSGNTLEVTGEYRGLVGEATGIGIYAGGMGLMGADRTETAELIGTIPASGQAGSFSGSVELNGDQIAMLNGNGIFAVVQTDANPIGEIRGWLVAGNTGTDTAL